ncbi:transposase [Mesorhizobium sp. Cs1299R1N3]|uniref:transposase n=1 Tax=Mesorhizobium sp. Cs1299R1N3 TaxID=3015173 RepID=UPI00301DDD09
MNFERLGSIIKQLRRSQFGRGSEWVDPDQLALSSSPRSSFLPRAAALRRRA